MQVSRRALLGGVAASALFFNEASARFPHGAAGAAGLPSGFSRVKIGGGGYTTGINISSDGLTWLCREDGYGAYLLNTSTGIWQQIVLSTSMGITANLVGGVFEIVSAPSNSARIYMIATPISGAHAFDSTYGQLYTSTDRGTTFTACAGWTQAHCPSNGSYRFFAPRIAVHPTLEQTIIATDADGGIYYSTNAGTTMTAITGIAAPDTSGGGYGYTCIFDLANGNNAIVCPFNKNAYITSTGVSGTWSATTGGPFSTGAGVYLASGGGVILGGNEVSGTVYRYRFGSGWDTITGCAGAPRLVAIDPTNTTRAASVDSGGGNVTTITAINGTPVAAGQTVAADNGNNAVPQADVPWLGYSANAFMSTGGIAIDPTLGYAKIYVGDGVGVYSLTPLVGGSRWLSKTAGIESLEPTTVISPSGTTTHPVMGSWDRQVQYITNPAVYPSQNAIDTSFNYGWHLDWAASDGLTICALIDGQAGNPSNIAKSSDGGATWAALGSAPNTVTLSPNSGSSSGTSVLHFASLPPEVFIGMRITCPSNGGALSNGNTSAVLSISGGGVTLNQTLAQNVTTSDTFLFSAGGGGNVAVSTSTNFVYLGANNYPYPMYTTDGGATWNKSTLATAQPLPCTTVNGSPIVTITSGDTRALNGNINNVFLVNGTKTIKSIDSLTQVTLTTNATNTGADVLSPPPNYSFAYYLNFAPLAADRVTANKFYLFNAGQYAPVTTITGAANNGSGLIRVACVSTANLTNGAGVLIAEVVGTTEANAFWSGITVIDATHFDLNGSTFTHAYTSGGQVRANIGCMYVSTDGGANFSLVSSSLTNVGLSIVQAGQMKCAPLNAGHVYLGGSPSFAPKGIYRSTNAGVTWALLPTISAVSCYGFGKPKPAGGGYPTIFAYGTVGGVQGWYRSDDGEQTTPTWSLIPSSAAPMGILDPPVSCDGDKNIYNQFYFVGNTSGMYGYHP